MPKSIGVRIHTQNLAKEKRFVFTRADIILLDIRYGKRFYIHFCANGFPLLPQNFGCFSQIRPIGRNQAEFKRNVIFFPKTVVASFPSVTVKSFVGFSYVKFKFFHVIGITESSRSNRRKYFFSLSGKDVAYDRLPVSRERKRFSHFAASQSFAFLLAEKNSEIAGNVYGNYIAAFFAFDVGESGRGNVAHSENLLVIVSLKKRIFIKIERKLKI